MIEKGRSMDAESYEPLSLKDVTLLKQTFKLIDLDRLAIRFYTTLFAKHPEVKSLFPKDLTDLSTKIVSVLELVVYSFEPRGDNQYYLQAELLKPLRSLGDLHKQKGVHNSYYPWVNELLLNSIAIEVGDQFSVEAENAWKHALNHLTLAMLTQRKEGETDSPDSMRKLFENMKTLLFKT